MNNSDLDVLLTAVEWLDSGQKVELVTLVKCWGSAPRPVGSMVAIKEDGAMVGSVSGGCIEKELASLLRKGGETDLVQHEISNEHARRYGMPCGGELSLVFERLNDTDQLNAIVKSLSQRGRVCREVDLKSGKVKYSPAERNQEFYYDGQTIKKIFGPDWRLLLIGAGELSRFVAEIALALDYEVLVCEPRQYFTDAWKVEGAILDTRSPDDSVIALSSDPRSAVLALSHDPNLDDLALVEALPSSAFYVGALGSKKNNRKRKERLIKAFGLDQELVERLHGPIGLDIGSKTPAEIAISILAEITAVRYAKCWGNN